MSEKKKIALASNTSWSIYNFRLGLIRKLKDLGYEVHLIAPRDNFTAKLIAENFNFHELALNNYGTNPIREFSTMRQFSEIYKKIKPDLVFHYTIKPNIYGSIAAHYNKIPSIAITTGLGQLFNFKNPMVRMMTLRLYRYASKVSKEVWFLNDNDRDVFVYKNIVNPKKTRILKGEGIDTNWFKPTEEKDFTRLRFLFAGRLIWDKGVNEFIEAANAIRSKYENIDFELVGFIDQTNPNAVPYEKILDWQKRGTIKYHGETTDIRPYLQAASCVVFPSYYREGVSRILMEAASMETPIITTDHVGCKNLVDHGRNGFLMKTKSTTDLVAKLENFIGLSDEDKMVMGKLGRQKMEREYKEERIIEVYLKIIEKYLGTRLKSTNQTYQSN